MRLFLTALLTLAACKSSHDSAPAGRAPTPAVGPSPKAKVAWPAGPARADKLMITGAFYVPDAREVDLGPFGGVCKAQSAAVDRLGTRKIDRVPFADFAPPREELLETFGRGLDEAQKKAVQKGPDPLRIIFTGSAVEPDKPLRAVTELIDCYCRATGAYYWDEDTRELYTCAEHRKHRLDDWKAGTPALLSRHFTIHSYEDGELLRQVTLGLGKLGLPDIVINGVAPNLVASGGMLVNLLASALHEGAPVGKDGDLVLDVHKLRAPRWQELARSVDEKKAPGRTSLKLSVGERDTGDADNRLVEINFDAREAGSTTEQQGLVFERVLGPAADEVLTEDHDAEALEAMAQGRAQLKKLKPRWDKGLKIGQSLIVKAPFRMDDDGGNEWMWIHVTEWKGKRIKGTLDNSPEHIAKLKLGAIVDTPFDEIADYGFYEGDKLLEGYVFTNLMLKRHGRAPR
jgi:uncharacterized protein YegJ (DUF2314 family)